MGSCSAEPKGTMCDPWAEARTASEPRKGAMVSLWERGPSVLSSTPIAPARCAFSDCAEDDGW